MPVSFPIVALSDNDVADPAWFEDITDAVNDHENRMLVVESYTARITRKLLDQTVTNNATPQNDAYLVSAVDANTNYAFEVNIFYSALATVDIKVALTWPTSAVCSWMVVGYEVTGTTFEVNLTSNAYLSASGTSQVYGGGFDYPTLQIKGLLRVGATAGNLQFQFANSTAGVGNTTTVKQESWMRLEKVIA